MPGPKSNKGGKKNSGYEEKDNGGGSGGGGSNNNNNKNNNNNNNNNNSSSGMIDLQDQIYVYDNDKIDKEKKSGNWRKARYFQRVRINVLAATKMVKHAIQGVNKGRKQNGMPIEIMGLLVGRPDGDSFVIMDCVELPVEGTEARVVADDEKVFAFMTREVERLERVRKDKFIGWYHSHPFDVGAHSNCFFSSTDVSNQISWQTSFGGCWLGIVVDPLRCLAKQKVELGAFMCFPADSGYSPPKLQGPDGVTYDNKEKLQNRWGAVHDRYYQLKHSFFMGSLVSHNLEMMSRKHLWIRQLSANAILEPENRDEIPKRINTMTKKTSLDGGRRHGGAASSAQGGKSGKSASGQYDPLAEAMDLGSELAIEQCIGHSSQIMKNVLFNSTLSETNSSKSNNNNNNNSNKDAAVTTSKK